MRLHAAIAVLFLTAGAIGCGGLPASVSGVVTVDGQPVNKGKVTFIPVGQGQMAIGAIGDDGAYEVMTGREEGLGVGEYKVSVVAREMQVSEDGGPPMQGDYIVPKRYGLAETSGLQYTVESGHNEIDLELSSTEQ